MRKYHINPKTGNPNLCSAAAGNCPFGAPSEHFPTKEAAAAAYEKRHETFSKTAIQGPLAHGSKLRGVVAYETAPLNTVVVLENGLRFIKTNAGEWETSQRGGVILTNEELGNFRDDEVGDNSFGSVVTFAGDTLPASESKSPKGTIKASMLQRGAYEKGNQARKYFLLLNHRDPAMIAALNGKVEDQAVIDTILEVNELEERVEAQEASLSRAQVRRDNAKTDAQRAGYAKLVNTKTTEFFQTNKTLEAKKAELDQHMKRYAKQYVLHYRSLDSMEKLVNAGVRATPPGLSDRIKKLEATRKTTRSVKNLSSLIATGDSSNILEAAQRFGNPAYVKAAKEFNRATESLLTLESGRAKILGILNKAQTNAAHRLLVEDLLDANKKVEIARLNRVEVEKSIALFRDDIRDRDFMETALDREIAVLRKMGNLKP